VDMGRRAEEEVLLLLVKIFFPFCMPLTVIGKTAKMRSAILVLARTSEGAIIGRPINNFQLRNESIDGKKGSVALKRF
jgi:hypothetical protein